MLVKFLVCYIGAFAKVEGHFQIWLIIWLCFSRKLWESELVFHKIGSVVSHCDEVVVRYFSLSLS